MTQVMSVIDSMPTSVRNKAQAFADAKGMTLEEAVTQQLSYEISDSDLDSVSGGRVDVEIDAEANIDVIGIDITAEADLEIDTGRTQ